MHLTAHLRAGTKSFWVFVIGLLEAKTILWTKLTSIVLLVFCMQAGATGYAQKLSISGENLSLKNVFSEIKKQSGYSFFYSDQDLARANKVTIHVKNVELEQILKQVFNDQPLTYSIIGKTVVVREKDFKEGTDVSELVMNVSIITDISGKVTDENGRPLKGVSVTRVGTKKGTTTDNQGRFILNVPNDKNIVLEFSNVGFQTKRIELGEQTEINVVMKIDVSDLNDLVVVGYGTSKVKDMTGSVSRVTAKDLEGAPPHADMASLLQGKAAGVNVMIANGAPGATVAVQIRGTTSLTGNNQPLWVIDGIPQYNVNGSDIASNLLDFNINDIESIDVLKDASATAIYGSRAANGVIIVTTKRGKENARPQIDFSYNLGIQGQADKFRMLNTDEYKQVITETVRNYFSTRGTAPTSGILSTLIDNTMFTPGMEIDYRTVPLSSNAFFNGTTNWWNELTQSAVENKYDVSIRGGTPLSTYFLSAGFSNQQGVVKGSDRKGLMVRMNFDTKVAEKIKVGMQMNGSFSVLNNKDNMIDKIWNFRPDYPMYDNDGKDFDPGYNEENPLTSLKNRLLSDRKGLNGTGFFEYKPFKEVLLRSSISTNYSISTTDRFLREGTVYTTHSGQANLTTNESSNYVFENTATYSKKFSNRHELIALGGFTMEEGVFKSFSAGAQNFPDQDIMTNISSGATPLKPTSTHSSSSLVSALSRINYKYGDRYLATITSRMDGSSRFGPDKRWGFFPSAAIAWIISNEKFMKTNFSFINHLKFRTSFGRSGSQVLGNSDWRTLHVATQYLGEPAMTPSQLGNKDLQWEQTVSADLGLDFALFNNRLRGTFGIYRRDISDIIYSKGIPASSAFTSAKQNVASIRNEGVEFNIGYNLIRKRDITLSFDFNVATNMAICREINGLDSVIEIYAGNAIAMRIKQGEPIQQWVGHKWSGRYYQSMEEYNLLSSQNPLTGAKVWYQSGLSTIRPGDIRFEDVNGDGVVDTKDRIGLGTAQPKLFGGFSQNFRWKSLSLQANFSYSMGAMRYWYTNSANWYAPGLFLKNYPAYVLDTWSEDNRTAAWPRMAFGEGSSNSFSDFWLSRADFLRLNLLGINYRIPGSLIKMKTIGSIDFSISASNIFTITNYKGIDPQGNFNLNTGGIAGIGTDYGTYPSMRSYNFSARISLR